MIRPLAALADLDHLVRFYQLGFVAVWPLLGLSCVSAWSFTPVVGLMIVAFLFNAFGVVLDDALHVDVDRSDPRRADDWVVRGTLSSRHALGFALLQIPLMVLAHVALGFPASALIWLIGAIAGMAIYDVYGKRSGLPPLPEAAQAACAALLVVYGAAVTRREFNSQVWPMAAAGAAFLLLVNAFHGGLRDIDNEIGLNQRTVPIWLGCRGTQAGVVHITHSMSLYAGLWQAALVGLPFLAVLQLPPAGGRGLLLTAIVVVSLMHAGLFVVLHRLQKPAWDVVLRLHIVMLPVPMMLAVGPRLGAAANAALFGIYLAPGLFILPRWHARRWSKLIPRAPRATPFQTGS